MDRVVLVSDADIRRAQEARWAPLRTVAEPGGAAALAGLVSGTDVPEPGERVSAIIGGADTTAVDSGDALRRGPL